MRTYRLGKRQGATDRTRELILAAAHELVASGSAPSVAAIARRAGVSRITIYNRFRSRAGLFETLGHRARSTSLVPAGRGRDELRRLIIERCAGWAADPAFFRHLPPQTRPDEAEAVRGLAERLAGEDELRPGCSIREAEDVIDMLTSFPVFDRLHRDGRRPASAVAEILVRLAAGVLA